MANMGTAEVMVRIDPSRIVPVAKALAMLVDIATHAGHSWTDEERAVLAAAEDAFVLQNLLAESR